MDLMKDPDNLVWLNINTVLLVCVASVVAPWVWRAVNWVWLRPRRLERYLREQGFAGQPYRFLVGDMKESSLLDKRAHSRPLELSDDIVPRVLPLLHKTVKNHGGRCFTWLGPMMNVVITEPEAMREILTNHAVFQKPIAGHPAEDLAGGLVRSEGHQWSKYRNLSNPAYHVEKLKHMLSAVCLSCEEMVGEWERLAASSEKSVEVDMWPYCHDLSCDMLARVAFGSSYREGLDIFLLQKQQVALMLQTLRSVYIPGSRYLPTKFNRTLRKIQRKMKASLSQIIKKRTEQMCKGEDSEDDLLGSLLAADSRLVREQGGAAGLTMRELIELCKDFYLAGENAVSVFLVWTMVMLSQHQEWQERAREEIFRVFGDGKLHLNGLNQLKTVNIFLHEVLRMFPPAHYTVRTVHQDTKLSDFVLPAGIFITLPILLFHYNADLWGSDVDQFRPERFEQGVANATKGQLAFFPFSYGPRTCIGQNLAMVKAKAAVAMILRRFRLELSPSYTHAPYPSITIVPQHGAHIILHKI